MVSIVGGLGSTNPTPIGGTYDGVVRISTGQFYGTGSLLWNGTALLTAAHLFDSDTSAQDITVHFETSSGNQQIHATHFTSHPLYNTLDSNHDLAIIWLDGSAPLDANRYQLYRESDEISKSHFELVGYGTPGTGNLGMETNYHNTSIRQIAHNDFEDDYTLLLAKMQSQLAWNPVAGTQLIADFDNGLNSNDALGTLLALDDPIGQGINEGIITSGDSGGPAFIDTSIAGIASYGMNLYYYDQVPDIDDSLNSSFGEMAAWTRVSHYQKWIDHTLQDNYPNAPTTPEEVQKYVQEGNTGTTFAYFMVNYHGSRPEEYPIVSVDYRTFDGTATANQDYIPTQGTLKLYTDENFALIPVEIIGDSIKEDNETFYLQIYNPVGGGFSDEAVSLTASKTIIDDDLFF